MGSYLKSGQNNPTERVDSNSTLKIKQPVGNTDDAVRQRSAQRRSGRAQVARPAAASGNPFLIQGGCAIRDST